MPTVVVRAVVSECLLCFVGFQGLNSVNSLKDMPTLRAGLEARRRIVQRFQDIRGAVGHLVLIVLQLGNCWLLSGCHGS